MGLSALLILGAACVVAGAAFAVLGVRAVLRERRVAGTQQDEAGDAARRPPWVVPCGACGGKLRLPHGRGVLRVTCPRCQHRFGFDTVTGARADA